MPISEVQHKLEILSPERKFLRAARIPRLPGVRIQRFTTALEGGVLADGRTRDLPVKVDTNYSEPDLGELFMFATTRVCNELIEDTLDVLRKYKAEPVIELFRERKRLSQGYKWSLTEFLMVSDVCLRATESKEGQMFDPNSVHVGPPNAFATITRDYGFKWEEQP